MILNGPNLNCLGTREIQQYGKKTLEEINDDLLKEAYQFNIEIISKQSNAEFELIDYIHEAKDKVHYIIMNPAAFTHTSIAIRDALLVSNIPFIEVHLSNPYTREHFRHHSYFSDISAGLICGLGADGYIWALRTIINRLSQ
jgi:3-dehydroquinate dehydratase-2